MNPFLCPAVGCGIGSGRMRGIRAFTVALLAVCSGLSADTVVDQAVQLSAVVQTNPPAISLSWPASANALRYHVYRKPRDASAWGPAVASLGFAATNYVDSNVLTGVGYEYRVSKTDNSYGGEGYLYAGIRLPLTESRGKILLIVDNTHAASLIAELERLQRDLVGDGWTVVRHDVVRTNSVTSVKALIQSDYGADPANVRSVFLFGHVPVPYAGNIYPDGHSPDHQGAWPSDGYYGDMDGLWTDTSVSITAAADPRNRNVPGDGKFDPGGSDPFHFPSAVELQVGRVDLFNLPAFALSECELLRQYLNKDHDFRHKLFSAEARGLIDDNFGVGVGEAFAADGWRNFAAFFGASNTFEGDWISTLQSQSYLWGYACGPANFTHAQGVTSTAELAANDPKVVFTMLYGSYFADWDAQDDLLRAPLATPTHTLTCVSAGRPHWQFHHMALGETIGFSARLAQNNDGVLYNSSYAQFVHIALMGDPALRMHVVAPPANLTVATNSMGRSLLQWTGSPDAIAGYAIYRATNAAGPFTRLNSELLTTNRFSDPAVSPAVYMVRAVKLEVSSSGSYFNVSQGIFEDTRGSFNSPNLSIRRSGTGIQLSWPGNAMDFQLQDGSFPMAGDWQAVGSSWQLTNGAFQVELPLGQTNQFFRLVR